MMQRASVDLPHPDLAHQRQRLAAADVEGDVRHRVHAAPAPREDAAGLHREVLHHVLEPDEQFPGCRRRGTLVAVMTGLRPEPACRQWRSRRATASSGGDVDAAALDRPCRSADGTGSPAGGAIRLGGWPGIGVSRAPIASARGIESSRPCV